MTSPPTNCQSKNKTEIIVAIYCRWKDDSITFRTNKNNSKKNCLTVRLLVAGTGSGSSELLGLALPGIGDQKGSVELDQDVLDGFLALLIDV
jgi:hypothetical protein